MESKLNNKSNYLKLENAYLEHIIILANEHTFLVKDTFIRSLLWYELYKLS
jgi:hypothetical protein